MRGDERPKPALKLLSAVHCSGRLACEHVGTLPSTSAKEPGGCRRVLLHPALTWIQSSPTPVPTFELNPLTDLPSPGIYFPIVNFITQIREENSSAEGWADGSYGKVPGESGTLVKT